jgi:hypothetical protein
MNCIWIYNLPLEKNDTIRTFLLKINSDICRVFQNEHYNFESLNLFRRHVQCFNCHDVAIRIRFYLALLCFKVVSTSNAGCFKNGFTMVFQSYCEASVTKKFTLTGVQTIHRWPLLWSSGESFWLQIQKFEFDYRRYQIFWEVVGLEMDPLSLLIITEELHGKISSGSCLENRDYGHRGSVALTTRHHSIGKSLY